MSATAIIQHSQGKYCPNCHQKRVVQGLKIGIRKHQDRQPSIDGLREKRLAHSLCHLLATANRCRLDLERPLAKFHFLQPFLFSLAKIVDREFTHLRHDTLPVIRECCSDMRKTSFPGISASTKYSSPYMHGIILCCVHIAKASGGICCSKLMSSNPIHQVNAS